MLLLLLTVLLLLMLRRLPEDTILGVVEMSLAGSEYALEAWWMIKRSVLSGEDFSPEEEVKFDELYDRAKDDLEGPGLRVDLTLDRIY